MVSLGGGGLVCLLSLLRRITVYPGVSIGFSKAYCHHTGVSWDIRNQFLRRGVKEGETIIIILFLMFVLFLPSLFYHYYSYTIRNWPLGRSIFHDRSRDLVVWVNQSDHVVIKSLDKRGNVRRVTSRLCSFLSALQTQLQFSVHPEYGYLSVNPGHTGTGLEASVIVHLPYLARNYPRLRRLCDNYDILIRRQRHHRFELATQTRRGASEFQIVTTFFNGIREIVEIEKGCEANYENL